MKKYKVVMESGEVVGEYESYEEAKAEATSICRSAAENCEMYGGADVVESECCGYAR